VATYLLDTDVLSALMSAPRLTRRRKIEAWLRSLDGEAVLLSSVSTAEVNRGAALVKDRAIAAAKSSRRRTKNGRPSPVRRLFRKCGVFVMARMRLILPLLTVICRSSVAL
jgi:predicted nucleic acid-binding protein